MGGQRAEKFKIGSQRAEKFKIGGQRAEKFKILYKNKMQMPN